MRAWFGYKEEGDRLTFVVPPTWRDIPAILKGTYKAKVIDVPRATEADFREAHPEFLFGMIPEKPQVQSAPPSQRVVHNHYSIYGEQKRKKSKRAPYKYEEPVGEHPAVRVLNEDPVLNQTREREKPKHDVKILVTGPEKDESWDLLSHN